MQAVMNPVQPSYGQETSHMNSSKVQVNTKFQKNSEKSATDSKIHVLGIGEIVG